MAGENNHSFQKKIFVTGVCTALTGLHVGGSSTEMSIGGADLIVIRDPLSNYPYIPGSSLRGKMRSLLERHRGEMTIKLKNAAQKKVHRVSELGEHLRNGAQIEAAQPASDPASDAAQLFGIAIDADTAPPPQRLVVRDAMLTDDGVKRLLAARNTDMPLTEVKTEVTIDRITSKANPRQIERVPAGAEFAFEMVLNLYGDDQQEHFLGLLWECMELLQDDYLGGHGSRGYGKVKFSVKKLAAKTIDDYRANRAAAELDVGVPESLV